MDLSVQAAARATAGFGAADPRADIEANARNMIIKTRATFAHPVQAGRCDEPEGRQCRARRAQRPLRIR